MRGNLFKKAQVTMESLLLYGVAILVVLFGIAALMYFGVLDFGNMLPERCNLEGSGVFTCEEWQVNTDTGNVSIVVKNSGSKVVDVSALEFISTEGYWASCDDTFAVDEIKIAPGESELLFIDCGADTAGIEEGQRIKVDVEISHKFAGGQLASTTKGNFIATATE